MPPSESSDVSDLHYFPDLVIPPRFRPEEVERAAICLYTHLVYHKNEPHSVVVAYMKLYSQIEKLLKGKSDNEVLVMCEVWKKEYEPTYKGTRDFSKIDRLLNLTYFAQNLTLIDGHFEKWTNSRDYAGSLAIATARETKRELDELLEGEPAEEELKSK